MAIKNIKIHTTGLIDIAPRIIYIDTDSTLSQVTATGFLNDIVNNQGIVLKESDMALVSTKTSPSATTTQVAWLEVSKSGENWSLVASNTTLPLSSANIFVGNASGVATGVAMSGDVAINNSGATTIQNNAVELAMLASGITPSHVVKFGGQHTTVGGGAAEAITVTGAAATDLAFVQMVDDGTNNVTIVNAVVTTDTLTVTFSGDPSNDTIINYQLLRAAS